MLFRVHLAAGDEAFIYLLVEHKSSADSGTRLQLLRYVVRVLTNWYEQNGHSLPLPPVLPLLAHQGPGQWPFSCEFVDLFGAVPAALRPFLPDFRHAIVDLAVTEDEELSRGARLRAFLKALKYSRRQDLSERLDIVLAEAAVIQRRDLGLILTYLERGPVTVSVNRVRQVLRRWIPESEEQTMGPWSQQYFEQGVEKGRTESRAKLLVRLLDKRFGQVPEDLHARIVDADAQLLETWFDRALDAADMESVFVDAPKEKNAL